MNQKKCYIKNMQVFYWNEILNNPQLVAGLVIAGTGLSIGSFDGIHSGHRELLNTLVSNCKKESLQAGVLTFARPLPSIKRSINYPGDLTTLQQRLEIFAKFNLDFAIVVDFDENFASRTGEEFFDLTKKLFNLKLLVEGVDFRCGYKGATDSAAIKEWASQNDVQTFFVEPVFYKKGESVKQRISSSFIRELIVKGQLDIAKSLLNYAYELDLTAVDSGNLLQVLPPCGVYNCKNEEGKEIKVEIKTADITLSSPSKKIIF